MCEATTHTRKFGALLCVKFCPASRNVGTSMTCTLSSLWTETSWLAMLVPPAKKFVDKTFAEGSNTAKFAKVFTRESFGLYGI